MTAPPRWLIALAGVVAFVAVNAYVLTSLMAVR